MHKHLLSVCLSVILPREKVPKYFLSESTSFAGIAKEQCPDKERHERRTKRRNCDGRKSEGSTFKMMFDTLVCGTVEEQEAVEEIFTKSSKTLPDDIFRRA